jgi:hypothetical protein
MGVSGDKKSKWTSLDISPLFFFTVQKLVQALVITYDEIFQALALEGDVLLPKPYYWTPALTVSSDGNRRPLEMFGKLKKISVLTISSSI